MRRGDARDGAQRRRAAGACLLLYVAKDGDSWVCKATILLQGTGSPCRGRHGHAAALRWQRRRCRQWQATRDKGAVREENGIHDGRVQGCHVTISLSGKVSQEEQGRRLGVT